MTQSPTHEQEPTDDDVRIAIERLSRFSSAHTPWMSTPQLRVLPDHVAIVLQALHAAEEKYQWLCAHVDDIAINRDTYGAERGYIIFGDTKDENRIYPNIDALVTAEIAKTKEQTG